MESHRPDWRIAARFRGAKLRMIRDYRGLTQAHLAVLATTSQQTVDRIERGEVRESAAFERIAKVLGYKSGDDLLSDNTFQPDKPNAPEVNPGRSRSDAEISSEANALRPAFFVPDRIPIYMSDDLSEPIQDISCPEPLIHIRGAYGVLLMQSDMEPAYEVGETVLLHPFMPPRPGSDILYRNASGAVLLRRFLGAEGNFHDVRRWQSEDIDRISLADWPIRHVVVGKYRRG